MPLRDDVEAAFRSLGAGVQNLPSYTKVLGPTRGDRDVNVEFSGAVSVTAALEPHLRRAGVPMKQMQPDAHVGGFVWKILAGDVHAVGPARLAALIKEGLRGTSRW
jgi:hypothetical protein